MPRLPELDKDNTFCFTHMCPNHAAKTEAIKPIALVERIGEGPITALFGLVTGLVFGVAAQRSRFCLRAAAVEFAHGLMQGKVAVWLLTFSTVTV